MIWTLIKKLFEREKVTELNLLNRIHTRLGWIMFWIIAGIILIIMTLGNLLSLLIDK